METEGYRQRNRDRAIQTEVYRERQRYRDRGIETGVVASGSVSLGILILRLIHSQRLTNSQRTTEQNPWKKKLV